MRSRERNGKPWASKQALRAIEEAMKPSGESQPARIDPELTTNGVKVKTNGHAGQTRVTMQQRYDAIVTEMKKVHNIRVRKWRNSMTGCAWIVTYENGKIARLIEAPYPRGPMSAAVFLHEIGHHAIGFGTFSPRCLEEYHAWAWSLNTMRQYGLNITPAVEKRVYESLHYAIEKAQRRGLKKLPAELEPYLKRPPRRRAAPGRKTAEAI